MRKIGLFTVVLLFPTFLGLSQIGIVMDNELILNDYYSMSVVNFEKVGDYLYLSCKVHEENVKPDLPMVYKRGLIT